MASLQPNNISSNSISIALSILPILPGGVVETFADGDVWTDDAVESADGVKTPDGYFLVWGKNAVITRTLTLAPSSKIHKSIERAVIMQQRRGAAVSEPPLITAVVRNFATGAMDTYTGGIIKSTEIGMNVGQERLSNRATVFAFAEVIPSVI